MIWRLKLFVLPSLGLILLSLTHSERNIDLEGNSQLVFFSYSAEPRKLKGTLLNISDNLTTQEHKNISTDLINDGIFWSDYAESLVPKGLLHNDSMALVKKLRQQHVKQIIKANQTICGSGQNGIVELEDGTTMCARYEKKYYLIFAEALAFYLSRLLGMDNVPEVVLSKLDGSSEQWKGSEFFKMDWEENVEVAMIKWLNNASSEPFMPSAIQNAYKIGKPVNSEVIHYSPQLKCRPTGIAELIQWGTLIIFDNLIGHYDRLIHYQPFKEPGIGKRSIYSSLFNSLKSPNGKIWLIDHESAFFYQHRFRDPKYNFIRLRNFHDKMLKTMCIFQLPLVTELRNLSKLPSAFQHLWDHASSYEPLFKLFKKDYRYSVFANLFNTRLDDIISWIDHCKSLSTEK